MTTTIRRTLEHRGSVYKLRRELENAQPSKQVIEVCLCGPRGTGKSNGVGYMLWKLCRKYPQARVLVIRTARSLLTDTFCKTFEEDVCPGDECIGEVARTNRHEYLWKSNGSRIVLGGLDDCQRYYGSDWDIIVPEEAVQFAWKDIEPFLGSLRNGKMPFHAIIYPTNPDAPSHWLRKRMDAGLVREMPCHHKDNPALYQRNAEGVWGWTDHGKQFMATLDRYTGVQRDRHVLGLWRGSEGMVWSNYDERVHLVDVHPSDWRAQYGIVECRIAVDWGFVDTGVLCVWGIDQKKRMLALAWYYVTGKNLEWWAARAVELAREFSITRMRADPSRKDALSLFNDHLGRSGLGRICYPANNKRSTTPSGDLGGLDLVRWGLEKDEDGIPRIRINKNGLRNPRDPALEEAGKPTFGPDEIPEYTFAKDARGEVLGDRTDPGCRDDFCDQMRYAATDNWPRDPVPVDPPPVVWAPNTYAGMVGTPESRMLAKLKRMRDGE